MRFARGIVIAAVAGFAGFSSPGAATAHVYGNTVNPFDPASRSYNGAWPVTVSQSQRSNGTGCLTLNGGSASLVFEGQKYAYGSFLVMNHLLIATITEPLYGQNGALMFIVPTKRGQIGQGIFENIEGGSNFDAGTLTFGAKNGC
jgi:hypothetical protein